jgi:hypothetical protein
MTKQEAIKRAAVMVAWARGSDKVEYRRNGDKWIPLEGTFAEFNWDSWDYRIATAKPTPRYIDHTVDTIPCDRVAVVRNAKGEPEAKGMVSTDFTESLYFRVCGDLYEGNDLRERATWADDGTPCAQLVTD